MYLNIKTAYSFKSVYGTIENIITKCKVSGATFAGIADTNNTFGHVQWQEECKRQGIKPIFGVTLPVYSQLIKSVEHRRISHNIVTLIALNLSGLREIYALVDKAHQNFYYTPRISITQLNMTTTNILILSGHRPINVNHENLYRQVSPGIVQSVFIGSAPSIAAINNNYIEKDDSGIYESFVDPRLTERRTTPQHLMTWQEWSEFFPKEGKALKNLLKIANQINFTIKPARMVQIPETKHSVSELCKIGAKTKGIDLKKKKYKARLKLELKLIKSKGYEDYFLIVSDLVQFAKTRMLVGPARGSAAGSLVCYLLDITEVNPLEYGLLFERFLDKNRTDLPDIDLDFQDDKRHLILAYLKTKYGSEKVAQIGNISRLQHKSALNRLAKALFIPLEMVEETKTTNDMNGHTFKKLIKDYPALEDSKKLINHPLHTSIHAAGIIVSGERISHFCALNSRDEKQVVAMVDKIDAETLNLLKIDVLGLRTLTIIADCLSEIGKSSEWLYGLPKDDKKTYKLLNNHRFQGIFQFEGEAIQSLAKRIKLENIEDLSTLCALCRPGALSSGGANRYIKRRTGKSKTKYLDKCKSFVKITKETFGVIVYQEQVMKIAREYAGLSWPEVGKLRKAVAKSKGLNDYHKMFLDSAIKNGHKAKKANLVWNDIVTHGEYSFNLSHSISYAFLSYYTAYLKANFPLEFTHATLNHTKDDFSGLKFLRDMVENSGIDYEYFNPEYSVQKWSIRAGTLVGSLLSLDGIGPAAANKFVKCRKEGLVLPAGIVKKIDREDTIYKHLYPATEVYGKHYREGAVPIKEIKGEGKYKFIGRLSSVKARDLNEQHLIEKRGGEYKTGETSFLQITLEDDTDSISCVIWSDKYEDFGKEIAETGKEKDWYKVIGELKGDYRSINVRIIRKITKCPK